LGRKQAAQRVAEGRLARMAQVQWAGRIGRNELDQQTQAVGRLGAELRTVAQDLR
jgi:hypothetical protein